MGVDDASELANLSAGRADDGTAFRVLRRLRSFTASGVFLRTKSGGHMIIECIVLEPGGSS
jgi:hypothetical protein